MIMALIKDYGKNEPWLNLALVIGIIGEVISIVALTVLSGAVSFGFGQSFYKAMLTLVMIICAAILFFKATRAWYLVKRMGRSVEAVEVQKSALRKGENGGRPCGGK
jgi:Kef-type K+ transport system membrane component KefB